MTVDRAADSLLRFARDHTRVIFGSAPLDIPAETRVLWRGETAHQL